MVIHNKHIKYHKVIEILCEVCVYIIYNCVDIPQTYRPGEKCFFPLTRFLTHTLDENPTPGFHQTVVGLGISEPSYHLAWIDHKSWRKIHFECIPKIRKNTCYIYI